MYQRISDLKIEGNHLSVYLQKTMGTYALHGTLGLDLLIIADDPKKHQRVDEIGATDSTTPQSICFLHILC